MYVQMYSCICVNMECMYNQSVIFNITFGLYFLFFVELTKIGKVIHFAR